MKNHYAKHKTWLGFNNGLDNPAKFDANTDPNGDAENTAQADDEPYNGDNEQPQGEE